MDSTKSVIIQQIIIKIERDSNIIGKLTISQRLELQNIFSKFR